MIGKESLNPTEGIDNQFLYFESPARYIDDGDRKSLAIRSYKEAYIIDLVKQDGKDVITDRKYFDLLQDPHEKSNIIGMVDRGRIDYLEEKLFRRFPNFKSIDHLDLLLAMADDEKIKKRLKDLGYF